MVFDPAALKRARRGRGLTQEELGRIVGCTSVAVGLWEMGSRVPSLDHQRQIAKALRVYPEQLHTQPEEVAS